MSLESTQNVIISSATDETITDRENMDYKASSRRKTRIITSVTIICIILAGIIALAISLSYFVSSKNTIFPNVWVEGVNVSGMTVEEATNALIAGGYETNADGIGVSIIFPDESVFFFTGEQVGLSYNAGEAAMEAYNFGRLSDSTFFGAEIAYVRSIFVRTDLSNLCNPEVDYTILQELSVTYSDAFNDSLVVGTLDQTENYITIVKGSGFEPADSEEVFDLAGTMLWQSISENREVVASYFPQRREDDFDLELLFEHIHVEPVSSYYDPMTESATPSSPGRTFDLEAATDILEYAGDGDTIIISILDIQPEFTTEQIEAMIFRDLLHESRTQIAGTADRLHNIVLTAREIDGTILQPNEVFSFNEVVGRRTEERGFRRAGVFVGGRLIDGLGGGICQTSSTIYDAVLHTTLEVVERTGHGMAISYLPLGNDATVSWGVLDFRFRNNTDFPLRILASVTGRTLSVSLIGTNPDGITVEVETIIISTTEFQTVYVHTENLYAGYVARAEGANGINGAVVDTYQHIFDSDGELIESRRVGRTTYRVQNRIYYVGTREPGTHYHYDDHHDTQYEN